MAGLGRYLQAVVFGVLAVVGFVSALIAAYAFSQTQTAPHPPFLLVEKTYDVLLPFLLTTVAVGAAGFAYTLARKVREDVLASTLATRARRDTNIRRLQEIYDGSLRAMIAVRRARRNLRVLAVRGAEADAWYARRRVFETAHAELSAARLEGERIRRLLMFDGAVIADSPDAVGSVLAPLESQFGAPFGILGNVLNTLDFQDLTATAVGDEGLVRLPDKLLAYINDKTSGNSSFHKGAEQFDVFSRFVLERLRALEREAPSG